MIFYWQTKSALKESKNLNVSFNVNEMGNFSVAHTEAVVRRCSLEKVFSAVLQNSQENSLFLTKLQALGLQLY